MRAVSMRSVTAGIACMLAAVVGLGAVSPAAGQDETTQSGVEVDGAVQVTDNPMPSRGHVAPEVAVHPDDDTVLAVAEGDVTGGDCSVHVSVDRGLSWRTASRPELPDRWTHCPYTVIGHVVDVTFGPEGTLYFAFSGFDAETNEGQVFLAQSDDLGASWDLAGAPRIERDLDEGEVGLDSVPSVAVDPNDPSKVYLAWSSNWAAWTLRSMLEEADLEYYWDVTFRPYVAASTDGGHTFGEPVNAGEDLWLTENIEGMKSPADLLVGNDGEVFAFFGESSRVSEDGTREEPGEEAVPSSLYMAVSEDDGETFDGRTVYTEPDPTGGSSFLWSPRADIDRTNGNLYVAWEQLSNADQPVSINVSRSLDGGQSWSEAMEINDHEPPRQSTYMELFPDLSVAPNGRVDVAWYDPRNDPTYSPDEEDGSNAFHDVYYTYSEDGGATWMPNERLTDRRIDRQLGTWDTGGIQGPLGIASTDEGAHVAWDDTRNATSEGEAQDIYFTRARHVGADAFFGGQASGAANRQLLSGGLGAGGALLLGGVLLLVTVGRMRSSGRTGDVGSVAPGNDG